MTISFRSQASETLLWYQQPADRWCEALPIGNGSQGGMIYGGTQTERIDFTDVTFFSGEPGDYLQEGAYKYLQPIRNALLARDYALAEKHIQHFIGMKGNYGTNLPLATLNLAFDHDSAVSDFRRSLDIDTALAQVRYRVADITYTRGFLASHPARALVIHLSADKSKSLNFKLKPVGANESFQLKVAGKDLQLEGHAYEIRHSDGKTGVTGLVRFSVALSEGTQSVTDNVIAVSEATSATVYITMATNFGNRDARALCEERMQAVRSQSYEDIKGKHVADHQALFHRVQFSLDAEDKKTVPTDIRRKHLKQGGTDVGLVPLMYQYARYLTIASTRPDSPLPSHLQGVWNDNEACRIGWTCDMHLDINTQMNYWLTETTNLQECSAPLFKWIEETLVPSGKVTAKQLYRAKGWVAHIVSNPWGFTAPGWSNYWGLHPTGGAWIATHFWDHYQFTGDKVFLHDHAYPVLKGCAEFFLDTLFEDPSTGYRVSGPSISPENSFLIDGQRFTNDMMPTCDRVLINEIFSDCVAAAGILNQDADLVQKIKSCQAKLPPLKIDSKGRLQEWYFDHQEALPQHRHMTHLLSVFPFDAIKPETDPKLAVAAWKSVLSRFEPAKTWEDTGWARSLLILNAARLWKTEAAYNHVLDMQRLITEDNLMVFHPAGAGAHGPVWELDGNTGMCMGVTEMLLQSHFTAEAIQGQSLDCDPATPVFHLLPALPKQWSGGQISGLCARGGFELAMEWKAGKLIKASICSQQRGACVLRYGNQFMPIRCEANRPYEWQPQDSL